MKKLIDRLFSDRNISAYVGWTIKYRYIILLAAALLTSGAVLLDMKIGVDSSIMALLKKDTPSVKRVNELEKKTGGIGDLIVMIESPDSASAVAAADTLLPRIRALKWVGSASYKLNDSLIVKKKLLFLDLQDLKEIKTRVTAYITGKQKFANPLFVNILDETEPELDFSDIEKKYAGAGNYLKVNISKDGRMLLVVIHPNGITSDISFAKSIYDELKTVVDTFSRDSGNEKLKVSIGGTYRNRLNEYDTIMSDLSTGTMLGVSVILVLLFIYFRRITLVVCVLVPLIMSEAWTFALAVLAVGDLNLITAFLIIILFGLGIDFGIHLINRYVIMRREGSDHSASLKIAIQTSGRASMISGMTVVVSFYMLMFSSFLGFRHFGFIAGTGILLAYIAYMGILPSLLTIANDLTHGLKIKAIDNKLALENTPVLLAAKSQKEYRTALIVIGAVILVTLLSVWKLSDVSFEYDFRNLRSQIPATREFNQKMRNVFSVARDPAVVMVKDAQDARRVEQYLKEKGLLTENSEVEDVKSINDIIPENQEEKLAIVKEIKTIVDSNKSYASSTQMQNIETMAEMLPDSPLTIKDIPDDIVKLFMGLPGTDGQLMYLYQRNSLLDLHNAEAFAGAVGKMTIDSKEYYAISEPLVYVDLITLLKKDSIIAIIAAFLIIAAIVFVDFGKFSAMTIILTPLCIGIVWMLGVMGMLSIKLNIFNMVILPSILGLGVDAAVHIYHRFNDDSESPVGKLLIETGGPNFLCTLINLVGFGGIITASHPGLRSIGELAIIGMSTCLVTSLGILPAIMSLLRKKRTV